MSGPLPTARPVQGAPGRFTRPGGSALRIVLALLVLSSPLAFPKAVRGDDSRPTAWQLQAGTAPLLTAPPPPSPATICIIDTGVTPTPDLEITARDTTVGGGLDDVHATPGRPGHGTVVAHFAAGRVNGWGGAGAFPHARVSSVRVFPEEGGAVWQDYVKAMGRCLRIDAATKVVVFALGGQSIDPSEAAELENRIEVMRRDAGFNVVAAAGNSAGETDFPGRFRATFSVTGVTAANDLCGFSARGAGVDMAAPGCDLEQAGVDGQMWSLNGTSFAAPVVAGVLAAIRSYRTDLSPDDAERLLLQSAKPGPFPILDAAAALRAAGLNRIADSSAADESAATPDEGPVGAGRPSAMRPPGSGMTRAGTEVGAPIPSKMPTRLRLGRIAPPRLHVTKLGRRLHGRARGCAKGSVLQLRSAKRRTSGSRRRATIKANSARGVRGRCVSEIAASRWVRATNPVR